MKPRVLTRQFPSRTRSKRARWVTRRCPDYSYNGAEYLIDASVDRLDDRYFPSTGTLANLQYRKSLTQLGADEPYEQIDSILLVDKEGRTRKVFEAERYPNRARNRAREAEYDRLGVPHETHGLGR